jgi:hypothetical protein
MFGSAAPGGTRTAPARVGAPQPPPPPPPPPPTRPLPPAPLSSPAPPHHKYYHRRRCRCCRCCQSLSTAAAATCAAQLHYKRHQQATQSERRCATDMVPCRSSSPSSSSPRVDAQHPHPALPPRHDHLLPPGDADADVARLHQPPTTTRTADAAPCRRSTASNLPHPPLPRAAVAGTPALPPLPPHATAAGAAAEAAFATDRVGLFCLARCRPSRLQVRDARPSQLQVRAASGCSVWPAVAPGERRPPQSTPGARRQSPAAHGPHGPASPPCLRATPAPGNSGW